MNQRIFSSFVILISCSILGCSDDPSGKTRVIFTNAAHGSDVVLSQYNPFNLEQTILKKGSIIAGQPSEFDLELKQSSFVYYKAGDLYGGVLLEPGDNLTISLPERTFSGKGRAANEFIIHTHEILSRLNVRNLMYPGASPVAFQQRMDSLTNQLKEFRDGYLDTASVSKRAGQLLHAFHDYLMLTHYQYFAVMNDVEKLRSESLRKLRQRASQIPLDDNIAGTYMAEYGTAIQLYAELQITKKIAAYIPEEQRMNYPARFLKTEIDTLLRNDRYPAAVKELYIAKFIDTEIASNGVTPLSDSLLRSYKTRFPESPYIRFIQKRYDKWKNIDPGKDAPDFTGVSVDGDTITLSQFRGKIVYVDVWATWCMPCIAEFPSSIALRQKLAQNSEIVFMYVSIDTNVEAWKRFIASNPNLNGIHLLDQNSSLSEPYLLRGIPRYILIDTDGRIINADAPRPSSPEIEELIQKALVD